MKRADHARVSRGVQWKSQSPQHNNNQCANDFGINFQCFCFYVMLENSVLSILTIDHVEQSPQRTVLLGNDNRHYVWLAQLDQLRGQ